MLDIFVLEEDYFQQARLEDAIHKSKQIYILRIGKVDLYDKPNQLLERITERGSHLLFFLDIGSDSDVEGGILVAQQIRERDPYASIVFITAHPELLPSTFQYRLAALDFIDKNLPDNEYEDRIISDIGLALSKNGLSQIECAFTVDTKNATIQVPFHKILYFETSPTVHKVILHTTEEQIEFYGQLSKIVKQDCRLYKCHKSFVVNPENIVRLDKELGIIYFENGEYAWFQKLNKKRLLLRCLFQNPWQFDVYSIFVLKCYFLIMTKFEYFMTSMKNLIFDAILFDVKNLRRFFYYEV